MLSPVAGLPTIFQVSSYVLLYDGATVAARMDRNLGAAAAARAAASVLLDAATAVKRA